MALRGAHSRGLFDLRRRFILDLSDPNRRFEPSPVGGWCFGERQQCSAVHNVYFVKYDVTVSFMAQVVDTVTYFVSHVFVVDTVTYCDIFW